MKALFISGYRSGCDINLFVRGEDNKKYSLKVVGFKPYFYVENPYGDHLGLYGEHLVKKYVDDPSDVPTERIKYPKSWEADIPYVSRFLIDRGIYRGLEFPDGKNILKPEDITPCEVDIDPLIMNIDIELEPTDKFPDIKESKVPIVCFTYKTNKSNNYLTFVVGNSNSKSQLLSNNWACGYYDNEKFLLSQFYNIMDTIKPDLVVGYNNMDFDLPYLKNRFLKLEKKWVNDRSFDTFDVLTAYKHIFSQPSNMLKRVAVYEGIEKEYRGSFKDISKYYPNDLQKFITYNKDDVYDCVELDKKHLLINFFLQLRWVSGIQSCESILVSQEKEGGFRFVSYSKLLDAKLLRIAKERGICLPTKIHFDTESTPFVGAYVYVIGKGLFNDVAVFDYNRYYPSIINSFCLSPENIVYKEEEADIIIPDEEFPSRALYLKKQEGIIQSIIKVMFDERDKLEAEIKKYEPGSPEFKSLMLRRQAVKDLTNAIFGHLGYDKSRVFVHDLARAITQLGREGTKFVIKQGEEQGYKILMSDTDSISVQVPFDKANDFGQYLNQQILKYFKDKYNIEVDIKLKFEKYVKNLLLTGKKKRHASRIIWENGRECDYIYIRGFENIRTDQSDFTRTLLSDLFNLILYEKSKKEIRAFIDDKLTDFSNRPLTEVAIARGLNKQLNKYKANQPHLRAAIYSNTNLKTNFKFGDRIKYLWVKGIEGLPQTDVFAFDDETTLPEGIYIDWKRMKESSILKKVEKILDAVGIDLFSTTKQIGLESL